MTDATQSQAPDGPIARLGRFFNSEEVPYGLALMRLTLPLVLLSDVLPHWPHVRELYSRDGSPAPLWVSYNQPDLLPIPTGPLAVAFNTALIVVLLTASLGWMTRISLIAATVLYAWFGMLDAIGTMTKYTVLSTHALFLLSLSGCGTVWSVDAWLSRSRRHAGDVLPAGAESLPRRPAWPRRLVQLLIGIVYLGASVTKLHTPTFFSGDHLLFWMLTDVNFENPLGEYMTLFPALLSVTAYATILWEILFVFLCWRGLGRICMLSVGIVFHALTWATLGLTVFPLVYLCLYCAFLEEADVSRLAAWFRRVRSRWSPAHSALARGSWPLRPSGWLGAPQSAAAFGLVLAALVVAGVEFEHRRDPYGERRPEGRYQLAPLSQDDVDRLFATDRPLRPKDKLFAFDVGTVCLGGIVVDRRSTFRNGEQAILQCSVFPPHADMWIEFNLRTAGGRVIQRQGQIMSREQLRGSNVVNFDGELPPGDYQFSLRFDGVEVGRKDFTLLPDRS